MNYRTVNNLKMNTSILGFGCMRFPVKNGTIDERLTEKMISYSIDKGVNYFDTAYPYHDGNSEKLLGKLLKEKRKDIYLASKLPCWLVNKYDDFDKLLDEQLKRLNTDYLDVYLFHGLFNKRWEGIYKNDVLKWADKVKSDGRIKNIGFSFHDDFSMFKEIIDEYDNWDLCQIQYNYLNENVQAGTKGYNYAVKKHIPVIVMEPLLGGTLANPPKEIKKILDDEKMNPVETALRWLWDKPEIISVLSGMSNFEQVKENITYAENYKNELSSREKNIIKLICTRYKDNKPIPCTKCRYCMPCPEGVDIPKNFEVYSEATVHKNIESGKSNYNYHMNETERASSCIGCKKCEEKCPQEIEISKWMPKIHSELVF